MSFFHVLALFALGEPNDAIAAERATAIARAYVEAHSQTLCASPDDLRASYAASAAGRTYVSFRQERAGLEVLNSQVLVRVLADGSVQRADESGTIGEVDGGLEQLVTALDAQDALLDRLLETAEIDGSVTPTFDDARLAIRAADGRGRLVWRVRLSTAETTGAWVGLVDARRGEVVDVRDDVWRADVVGAADARAVVSQPCFGAALDVAPLAHLRVRLASGPSTFTDAAGAFAIPFAGTSPQTLSASLSGRFAEVTTATGASLAWSGSVVPGTPAAVRFLASGGTETDVAQTNSYVHVTAVHDFVRARAALAGLDRAVPCNVNVGGLCNAFYSNGSIALFRAGGGCSNSATASVIAHEYGHFVDDVAGGIRDAALSEGGSDVLSLLYTGDPCEWRCMIPADESSCARDNSVGRTWPASECRGEPHCVGQTYAGFAWDVREALATSLGPAEGARVAEELFLAAFLANPATIPDAVREVFLADDDDDDLANGTRHGDVLAEAALRRGFVAPVPPTISSVSPASGRLCGGESVELRGIALPRAGTVVRVGGATAAIVSASADGTRVTVRAPQGATAGPVVVSATTAYGAASLADAYTYRIDVDAFVREGGLAVGRNATLDVFGDPGADFAVVAAFGASGTVVHGVALEPGPARVLADSISGSDPRASACGAFSMALSVPPRASLALRHVHLQAVVRAGGALVPTPPRVYTIAP